MMHVAPSLLQAAASEIAQKPANLPFFPDSCLRDRQLIALFRHLGSAGETKLEQDSRLLNLFTSLIARYAQQRPQAASVKSGRAKINRVCDFLQAHATDDPSLEELANVAGLSRFYLCRLFRREMGISISAYQMQIRIDRAKRLLAREAIALVASQTGFYDQSHFGWHFKRLVGTTPGKYQRAIIS